MATLSLNSLTKSYGKTKVLHGIDLSIADGEFVVFVGPSGCGKSTTLRMIAGLESVTSGSIEIGGRVVNNLEPKDRDIAMVFQNYAIYPHMSVRKNIGFGLRTSKLSKPEREARVEQVAAMLGMTDYLDRKPDALSGGQRQRVAIGRAMVRKPAVFLFDEPLSNLDAQLRTQTRLEIKKLHAQIRNTMVFVTHDQTEAMTMADRIVIMKDGRIQQVGTPAEVYHQPANTFVAQFIGAPSMNLLPAQTRPDHVQLDLDAHLPLRLPDAPAQVQIGIRPEDLRQSALPDPMFQGVISVVEPLGSETLLYVNIGGTEVIASRPGRGEMPKPGDQIGLDADIDAIHVFDAASGLAIR